MCARTVYASVYTVYVCSALVRLVCTAVREHVSKVRRFVCVWLWKHATRNSPLFLFVFSFYHAVGVACLPEGYVLFLAQCHMRECVACVRVLW